MFEGTLEQQSEVAVMQYQIPNGMHVIPLEHLDTRSDAMVDEELANPKPIVEGNEKKHLVLLAQRLLWDARILPA